MFKAFACLLILPLVLLILHGCSGDSSTNTDTDNPPGNNTVTVQVSDNTFTPRTLRIQPGTTVRWVLQQGSMTDHTTTANNGEWDSGFVFRNAGDSFQHTFSSNDNDKTFLYHCVTHWVSDEMQGSIQVGSNAPPPPPRY